MNTPSKILAVLLTSAVCLTACGDDKPAPEKTTQSTPSPTQNTPVTEPTQAAEQTKTAQSEPKPTSDVEKPKPVTTKEAPKEAVKAVSLEEGKARYEKTCRVCHDQGLLNAPKLTAKADWAKRLDKGMDTLYLHSAKGFGKMPAQVTGDVSEAEVYAAVDYMVSQVK